MLFHTGSVKLRSVRRAPDTDVCDRAPPTSTLAGREKLAWASQLTNSGGPIFRLEGL